MAFSAPVVRSPNTWFFALPVEKHGTPSDFYLLSCTGLLLRALLKAAGTILVYEFATN